MSMTMNTIPVPRKANSTASIAASPRARNGEESQGAEEEILLDENVRGRREGSTIRLGAFEVSPNHSLLAYSSTDTDGSETYTLRVKDLTTGELARRRDSEHLLPRSSGPTTAELSFYNTLDEAKRP